MKVVSVAGSTRSRASKRSSQIRIRTFQNNNQK
jgi:hypothetical protein